jgi:hypothetical protein
VVVVAANKINDASITPTTRESDWDANKMILLAIACT